jgi:hypothetical protein
VMLYDRKKEYMIPQIERKAGFKLNALPLLNQLI